MKFISIRRNHYSFFLISFSLLVLWGCNTVEEDQPVFESHAEAIDHFISSVHERGVFNGTILVVEDGEVIYEGAYGYADFETQRILNVETDFYLASVSNQFTAMAIMMLKEMDSLSYDDPLTKYFSDFPEYAKGVTIRHIMTHTSGIPDHFNLGSYKPGLTNNDVLEILYRVEELEFEPGDAYSYSNSGYVLLSIIAERASGQPYHQFMKERIFDPLGMDRTLIYDESEPQIENRAVGYNLFDEKYDYDLLTTGSGGMFSNVHDLFLWEQALYTDKLITQETLKEAFTPYKLNNDSVSNYGYGWAIQGDSIVTHSGGLAGYRTFFRRNMSRKNAIIFLTNNGGALSFGSVIQGINNILLDKPVEKPVVPIMIALAKSGISDIDELIEHYWELKKNNPDDYDFSEDQLNTLGYYYLGKKMMKEAIAIFKLNIEVYPNAFNPYDSLGEAYYVDGQYELSIEYYQKSIDLNPNNTNGIEMLLKAKRKQREMRVTNV